MEAVGLGEHYYRKPRGALDVPPQESSEAVCRYGNAADVLKHTHTDRNMDYSRLWSSTVRGVTQFFLSEEYR